MLEMVAFLAFGTGAIWAAVTKQWPLTFVAVGLAAMLLDLSGSVTIP